VKKTEPESVWDYPRPPRVEPSSEHVVVRHGGEVICDTARAYRVLETSHPPTYYLPPDDCRMELFEPVSGSTVCEFKGVAHYADLVVGSKRLSRVAWWYPEPTERFLPIRGYIALYPGRVDECTVDGERVVAQEGDFYGGWITSRVTGPFKGAPGTWGW
jgi:uncharacterized protein (DUF427 family)